MDIPAANHEQPWGHMGWRAAAPIAVPNGPQPGLQYPNKGVQNAPPIMGSVAPPPLGVPCPPPGAWPQQKLSQGPPPNHFNDMLCEPNPELSFRSNSQSPQGGSSSPPDSRVLSPSSESRYGLDPQCLPSAVQGMLEDREEWEGKVFVSEPGSLLPPLATTGFTVEDRGNASPRFIRCTSYSFPSEGTTAQLSHLPLGAILNPLARLEKGERPLPVCPGTAEGELVPGCSVCGAYMCPFMTWQDCGQRFSCPFCGKLTEVPWWCYQPTGGRGRRTDSERRPELSLGSYEVLESHTGQAAGLLLALDVSAPALKSGHLGLICQQLRFFLSSLAREEGGNQSDVRVGLMTYDSRLHLYDLSPTLSRPHMLIITDVTELELPMWAGLLVPLKDSRYCIDSLLQQIPRLAEGSGDTPSGQDLPVRAALRILEAIGCPGKVLVFQSAPVTEVALKHGSSGFFSSCEPKTLFQPSEPCVSLAKECANRGCSLHLFLFSQPDVGGAWPGHTPYLTGGGVYRYDSLQSEVNREQLSADLRRCVETETAFQAKLRVYISKGLSVSGFYGSFIPGPDPAHVSLAALDWRTALAVQFTHSSALDEQRGVVIQAALSYTSARGERRTRVHSLTLPCSRHLLDTFRNCQAQTLLAFYCKKVYCALLERPCRKSARSCRQMSPSCWPLTANTAVPLRYRRARTLIGPNHRWFGHKRIAWSLSRWFCEANRLARQLVLPRFLKALPVYVNSLRKSEVLLPGARSTVPQRLHLRSQLLSQDVRSTATHFYPLLLPLPMSSESPSALSAMEAARCSASSLDSGSLFLAHSGLSLVLWVGQCVPAHALLQLFNTTCFSLLPSGQLCLPELQNPLSVAVRKLIHSLQSQAPCTLRLQVVKQGDSSEEALQRLLVEDKSPNGGASYADFLYHLHVNSLRLLV